jgi:hypothetical protein
VVVVSLSNGGQKMNRIFLALILTLASVQLGWTAEKMSGAELTALLGSGKEIILGGPGQGYTGKLTLSKDGTGVGEVKLEDGTIIPIEGVWRIRGSKFCRTWKGGRDAGKQICETWIKTGPKSVSVKVGKDDKGVNSWN